LTGMSYCSKRILSGLGGRGRGRGRNTDMEVRGGFDRHANRYATHGQLDTYGNVYMIDGVAMMMLLLLLLVLMLMLLDVE
jgi:hypothetical protein